MAEAFAQENWKRVDELTGDDVVMRHCASGTPEQAMTMLQAYRDAGLDEIVIYGMHERQQIEGVLALMRPQGASIGR